MEVWEEHPEVYHYTNQSGLKGILETQSLHATHYAFMNDYKEMHAFETRLEQLMLPQTNKLFDSLATNKNIKAKMDTDGGIVGLAQHDATAIVKVMYRVTFGLDGGIKFAQPFITSFCGHNDKYEQENGLLSQWRYYGKESGYAIVFNTKTLNDIRLEEMNRYHYDFSGIGDVFYDKDQDEFNKEFEEMANAITTDVPRIFTDDKGPYDALNHAFMRSAPRYKHRAFFEEQEVRLVFSPTDDRLLEQMVSKKVDISKNKAKKLFKYRSNLAPYIALFEAPDIKLPITRIIVGPHADREMRKVKLEKHLDLLGLKIQVSCSETPVAL